MDHLKEGISLRGYAQKDPLIEYKREGFSLFGRMKNQVKIDTISRIIEVQLVSEEELEAQRAQMEDGDADELEFQHGMGDNLAGRQKIEELRRQQEKSAALGMQMSQESQGDSPDNVTVRREGKKTGRNDPCPCGSGKKYKKCHGK